MNAPPTFDFHWPYVSYSTADLNQRFSSRSYGLQEFMSLASLQSVKDKGLVPASKPGAFIWWSTVHVVWILMEINEWWFSSISTTIISHRWCFSHQWQRGMILLGLWCSYFSSMFALQTKDWLTDWVKFIIPLHSISHVTHAIQFWPRQFCTFG